MSNEKILQFGSETDTLYSGSSIHLVGKLLWYRQICKVSSTTCSRSWVAWQTNNERYYFKHIAAWYLSNLSLQTADSLTTT